MPLPTWEKVKAFLEAPDHRMPGMICLACKRGMDRATPTGGGRPPEPNDVAVCAYCGHLQAYGDDLQFRELNDAEVVECAADPDILMAQKFAADFRSQESKR